MDAPTPSIQKKKFLPKLVALLCAILMSVGLYFYFKFAPPSAHHNISASSVSLAEGNDNAMQVLQSQQQQLIQEMATLRAAMPQTVTQTARTEVLYYLRLADTSTTVLRDVSQAIALLQRAKTQVDATPTLSSQTGLSQALTEDIAALEGVHLPDFQALAQTISTLEQAVLTLPFKDETPAKTTTAPAQATSFWKSVGQDIATLLQYVVRVNRSDTGAVPYFLFPEQKALLREQVRVQLEQLLLAAMGHDTLLYQSKLKEIQNAINYFFDSSQETTVTFLQQLESLGNEVLVPVLPQANRGLLLLEQMR